MTDGNLEWSVEQHTEFEWDDQVRSPAKFYVLHCIIEHGYEDGLTYRELADIAGMPPKVAARYLSTLKRQALVSYEPNEVGTAPGHYVLTERGWKRYEYYCDPDDPPERIDG